MSNTDKDSQLSKQPLEMNAPQTETGYAQRSGVSNGIPVGNTANSVSMAIMEERKAQFEDEFEQLGSKEAAFSNFMKKYFAEKQKEVDSLKTKLADVTDVKESLQAEIDSLTSQLIYAIDENLRLQIEGLRQDRAISENPDQNVESSMRSEDDLLKERVEVLEWMNKKQAEQIKELEERLHEYEQNVVFQSPYDLAMEEPGSLPHLDGHFRSVLSIQNGEDNEDGTLTNREHDSGSKQENSSIMPNFRKEYYCPVSCISMVLSFIFDEMRLPVCNRRLNKKVQNELCSLSLINQSPNPDNSNPNPDNSSPNPDNSHPNPSSNPKKEAFKIGKCSLAFKEFYYLSLIDKEPLLSAKIENAKNRSDALERAIEMMKQESYPALFRMHYMAKGGKKRAGHCVAIMPNGKFIEVRKKDLWEPEKDSLWNNVNNIDVWKVQKKIAEEWEKECGLKICIGECNHNIDLDHNDGF